VTTNGTSGTVSETTNDHNRSTKHLLAGIRDNSVLQVREEERLGFLYVTNTAISNCELLLEALLLSLSREKR
jgi:hypothetical protein